MPSVSQFYFPLSSPKSPPRKRSKLSLKLKKKSAREYDGDKRENLFPIFASPSSQNACNDGNAESPTPPLPYAGLKNHGNVCYANAVLQVLRYCPGLLEYVDKIHSLTKEICLAEVKSRSAETRGNEDIHCLAEVELSSGDDNKSVVCGLKELFSQMTHLEQDYKDNKENCEHLLQRKNTVVLAAKPLDFMQTFRRKNPLFEDNLQHDAQEFLCSLLVNLHDTEKEIKRKAEDAGKVQVYKNFENVPPSTDTNQYCSLLEDLFHGQLLHMTKCLTCEDAKKHFENFQDVSVPVQKEAKVCDPKAFSPTPKKGQDSQSLSWALSQFARIEHLSGDNKYFCENCLTHTEAEISTSFDKLPKILTIHLKRFTTSSLSGFSGFVSKINSNLYTPMELSVTEWCSKTCLLPNPTYHLFGIVMHSGMTSCSGHYQAYVKVAMYNKVDLNNNRQPNHHDDYQTGNDSKPQKDRESSGMCEKQLSNMMSGTFCREGSSLKNKKLLPSRHENEVQSPKSSAEKSKTSCVYGITQYFLRPKKNSTKAKDNLVDGVQNGDLVVGEKQGHCSTPTNSFVGNSRSVNKIQSFHYHGALSNRSAMRQLNFQESHKQDEDSSSREEMIHTVAQRHVLETETFQWIHFDDAEVGILEESDVAALLSSSESAFTSPYLLFYKLAGS